jgi:hypothetical protein
LFSHGSLKKNRDIKYHCTALIEAIDETNQRLSIRKIKIQNSWSPLWGNQGCTWISFDDWEKYSVECFYGIKSVELAQHIKSLIHKFRSFKNYENGNMEPDNRFQGRPVDTSFIKTIGEKHEMIQGAYIRVPRLPNNPAILVGGHRRDDDTIQQQDHCINIDCCENNNNDDDSVAAAGLEKNPVIQTISGFIHSLFRGVKNALSLA